MPEFTQTGRAFRFESPLGADALLLASFVGEEATSRPFQYTVELLSENRAVAAADLLGKPVSIVFALADGSERTVRGVVRQFSRLGARGALFAYRAEVVPWLWLATLRSDIRAFQAMTVPDIVQKVLEPHSTNVQLSLTADYPPREFCVQYQESDFDFVSRLLEEEGISYFFTHTASALTMVLADAPSALKTAWQAEAEVLEGENDVEDRVVEITEEFAVQSDKVTVNTYHFETPSAEKLHSELTPSQSGALERYEFVPAFDNDGAVGKRHASVRLDAHESAAVLVRGVSSVRGLQAGAKVALRNGPTSVSQGEVHLLLVRHEANNGDYSGDGVPAGEYRNEFVAIPAAAKYRPPRLTPLPRAYGVQTAVVVGPSGEEIYVDKHGRVKVQFRWDRLGKLDEKSSAWVRVSQAWAGKGWGFLAHPRIGQEVLVEFVDGNPDHPVITGRVYNAEAVIPYAMDSTTTQSGIRTRSTKQAGADAFNELRFDDKKDSEELFVQAQKDLQINVKNDEVRLVGNDRLTTIAHDDTRTVKEGNDTIEITKGDRLVKVLEGNHKTVIKLDDATTILSGNQSVELSSGDQSIKVTKGNRAIEVSTGNEDTKIAAGNYTLTTSAGKQTFDAPVGPIELKVGASSIVIGTAEIALKCGPTTIKMTPSGIKMESVTSSVELTPAGVAVKGLQVGLEGTAMTEVKGLMVTVKADAIATLKGSITMIN